MLPPAPGTNDRNIRSQATLPLTLLERHIHIVLIYFDVFGYDGDQLVLQRLQELRRHINAVLNQY